MSLTHVEPHRNAHLTPPAVHPAGGVFLFGVGRFRYAKRLSEQRSPTSLGPSLLAGIIFFHAVRQLLDATVDGVEQRAAHSPPAGILRDRPDHVALAIHEAEADRHQPLNRGGLGLRRSRISPASATGRENSAVGAYRAFGDRSPEERVGLPGIFRYNEAVQRKNAGYRQIAALRGHELIAGEPVRADCFDRRQCAWYVRFGVRPGTGADQIEDQRGQVGGADGLGQESPSVTELHPGGEGRGHQQHLHFRPLEAEFSRQFQAGHYWHLDLRQEQMYVVRVISRLLEGACAAAGGQNAVGMGDQQCREGIQYVRLIVHDENGFLVVRGSFSLDQFPVVGVPGGELAGISLRSGRDCRWRRRLAGRATDPAHG
jgi:hypothetical protein